MTPEEVQELMRTTCNRPLKIVNKISREVSKRDTLDYSIHVYSMSRKMDPMSLFHTSSKAWFIYVFR